MFISLECIFHFIVLPVLFLIGLIIHYKSAADDLHKRLDEKEEQYNNLSEEYKKVVLEKYIQ